MRILLAHKYFRVGGGADVFFMQTGRMLEAAGHKVAYFATRGDEDVETPYSTYFVGTHDYRSGGPYARVRALSTAMYSFAAKKSMTRLICDFHPDVVHLFGIFTHLSTSIVDACRDAGIPTVMSCNDYKHICPNYKLYHHGHLCEDCRGGKFYMATVNRCCHDSFAYSAASTLEAYSDAVRGSLRGIDLFTFASDFMARKTAEFWGPDTFRGRVLRNPFTPPPHREPATLGDHALYFGRLEEEKGVDILLEASRLCPEIPVRIVGDGADEPRLRELADRLALSDCVFLGPVWGDEMDLLLGRSRLVVVPSKWHENYPYVVLQAFAAGKPVVGSNRGGIPELVVDGDRGILYEAEKPSELAGAMRDLWEHPDTAAEMGARGEAFVRGSFGEQTFVERLLAVYLEVVR
jgi:glycosyltransferase involved in cell wall biosynthesis